MAKQAAVVERVCNRCGEAFYATPKQVAHRVHVCQSCRRPPRPDRPSFAGYQVDPELGVVFGLKGRPLRKRVSGYIQVIHCIGKRQISTGAHRLIWQAVHGRIPDGLQINHINSIRHDNRIENLELVTPAENMQHAWRMGRMAVDGKICGGAILTWDAVEQIRASTESDAALAVRYGVSKAAIRNARTGRTWVKKPAAATGTGAK